ncbi:MAG: MATE family efflux transporter [Bacillota bacterium]|nr:MATE family efflux transporter [Bacillota bacterium]
MGIRKYIGTKKFYKMVLAIAVPIMIQNGISQFVSVLDNLMVGRLGTEQMSGVAIANQLIFIYNLALFGGLSGAGIFGAQFAGKGDNDGIRNVFRFKIYIALTVLAVGFTVLCFFDEHLIKLFLHESEGGGDLELTLKYGHEYIRILLWGLAPFALAQMYATSLREVGETKKPMVASLIAVITNLVLNYILIFGKLGITAMGARGAALATVISRFVELAIIAYWSHTHIDKVPFFKGVYKSVKVPRTLGIDIAKQGIPLLFNEVLWAMGMTTLTQCYSLRGLPVVAATNICYTISNLFSVIFLALGSTIGIVVGNLLGAGKLDEAVDTDRKMIAFSTFSCLLVGGLLAATSGIIPQLYNTSDEVRRLAGTFIIIGAVAMPVDAFCNACYFTLRSGGRTKITMIFDSGYTWLVMIPITAIFAYLTDMPIVTLYIVSYLPQIPKGIAGFCLVKSGKWIKNLVDD